MMLFFFCSFGQTKQYNYKRELTGIKGEWNKIILPDDIFNKISRDFSDIRISSLNEKKDNIEAAYFLQIASENISIKEVVFDLINQSKNSDGYYFTFEIPAENSVNQIKLDFNQKNFDWKLNLEGSQNQQEWFSILEDYRIMSIKNTLANFEFTKVAFPNSKYRFYRLFIKSKIKPELLSAKILLNETNNGSYKKYIAKSTEIVEEKNKKQTLINVELNTPVPVCKLKIYAKNKFDYYRNVTIQELSDSFKTQQGWKYNYSNLISGTINSIENNGFGFNSTILKKLKIIIENQDNEPLQIDSVLVEGYIHELVARFTEPAKYYLTYGNNESTKPEYDIAHFKENIPATLNTLTMGEEVRIEKKPAKTFEPLFKNKLWLWAIMSIIIILLGWFSFKMMKQKS